MSESDVWIKENVKCCACGMPMRLSPHINMVQLGLRAEWKYPAAGNVLTGQPCIEALAIVCDECVRRRAKIKYAIEWSSSRRHVKYHKVEDLKPLVWILGA